MDWVGPAEALPAEYVALPRTDYPGSTIMPGLIDAQFTTAQLAVIVEEAGRVAEQKIFVCPTVNVKAPYIAKLTGITVGEHAKAMHEMGVRIIAGTDAGIDNTPHHQYVSAPRHTIRVPPNTRPVSGCSPRRPGDASPRADSVLPCLPIPARQPGRHPP